MKFIVEEADTWSDGLEKDHFLPMIDMKVGELVESREDEYLNHFEYEETYRMLKYRMQYLRKINAEFAGSKFHFIRGEDRFWIFRAR